MTEWSKEEIKILKKNYSVLGTKTIQFLPGRTIDSIEHEARRQGINYGLFPIGEESFFDIETTNFNADFAYMLSYSFKVKGEDKYFSGSITKEEILSEKFDKRLVKDCIKDLCRFKRIYTYYGTKFDLPFIRTRALVHKIEFPSFGVIQHQDLYYLVKSKLKLSRNRLDNVTHLLGIQGKTHLDARIWQLAGIGDKKSLEYVLNHNIADCTILEKLYKRIMEYAGIQKRSI